MKRIMYLTYLSLFLTAGWSQTTGKLVGDVKDDVGELDRVLLLEQKAISPF